MPDKLQKKPFAPEFLTPLNAQHPGKDPGPEPNQVPVLSPDDPLGLLSQHGGNSTGKNSLKGK